MIVEKSDYRIYPDKVVYKPKEISANEAIKNAGAISAMESLPVELHIDSMVVNVKVAKLLVERVR